MSKYRIAIFASGSGSNAEKLHEYFQSRPEAIISLVITNNPNAGVIERCNRLKIDYHILKDAKMTQDELHPVLQMHQITHIVLAGYLKLIPSWLITEFPDRIVNIHPALLPSYGGKGMYGMNVHEAVVNHKEEFTGITIHLVNSEYDKGKVFFQKSIKLNYPTKPEAVANQIHTLEYAFFPPVIEAWLKLTSR